ncbi:penicillin-binding protein 1C [bacterium]|nr:penicillin-binding protein 1C [bacterium]
MQRLSKGLYRVGAALRRHKWITLIGGVILVWGVTRAFFMPPILSQTHFSRAFYDRHGTLLRLTLAADDKYRLYTPLNDMAPAVVRATLLYEDRWFYAHPGINPVSAIGATINYFTHRTRPIGASTITMQVARMRYDLDTRTVGGKLKQMGLALWLELMHPKREILEAYLNLAPYGGNIHGIGAAALIYFHRAARDLAPIESITLATIPQNPVKRGLNTAAGLRHMAAMRHDLVRRWTARYGDDNGRLATDVSMPLMVRGATDLPRRANHFVDREMMRDGNYWRHMGPTNGVIQTTLDDTLQTRLASVLRQEINARRSMGVENAAAILINYKTMETLAYIGSADYFDAAIFGQNDGVRARRSPGSTLKPLIYAMAADDGLIHPMTLLRDAKINFGVYAPENADNEFYGPVLARDALTHSRNVPAIDLLRRIGTHRFYRLMRDAGITRLHRPDHYGVSMALGGAEVSMYELAGIYAAMANLGMRYNIRTRADDDAGPGVQLLRPEAFFLTLDMLGGAGTPETFVPFARRTSHIRHYWKTGTSSSYRDAWTAGIFGDYVLVVWVGHFDGRPNNAFSGARTAAPIYFKLAAATADWAATHGAPIRNPNFLRDDLNISRIDMCDGVGGLAGTYCPRAVKAYFIPGVSPIETSSVYRAVPIDNQTGRRACTADPATTHMETFEFWDAEFLDMFRRAGIRRHTPPPFMPGCDLDTVMQTHAAPRILAPGDGDRLVITGTRDDMPIALRAVSDMPTARLFWFIDDDMCGTTTSGDTISPAIRMGPHTIRVMDEMGGGADIHVTVVK